jgi:RNA recognition motif-containing protein
MSRLFVGNLSYQTTAPQLGKLFETIGEVVNATIASSYNRSKGFGFVELKSEAVGREAVEKLNNTELNGRFV